jgi:hypothetical protein
MHNGLRGERLSIGIEKLRQPSYNTKDIGYIFIESIDIFGIITCSLKIDYYKQVKLFCVPI